MTLFIKIATSSWFFIQISPVKNAADCTVLFLLTFKEIAADRRTSTRRRGKTFYK